MFEDLGIEAEGDTEPVPIPNVRGTVLKKIFTWAEHYKDEPVANEEEDGEANSEGISPWDADFFNVEPNLLFELIHAANYLDVRGLLKAASLVVVNMIRGKSAEEVRNILGIENDFTPEEEEALKRDNEWCEYK